MEIDSYWYYVREEELLQVRCGPIPDDDDGDDEGPIIIPLRLA